MCGPLWRRGADTRRFPPFSSFSLHLLSSSLHFLLVLFRHASLSLFVVSLLCEIVFLAYLLCHLSLSCFISRTSLYSGARHESTLGAHTESSCSYICPSILFARVEHDILPSLVLSLVFGLITPTTNPILLSLVSLASFVHSGAYTYNSSCCYKVRLLHERSRGPAFFHRRACVPLRPTKTPRPTFHRVLRRTRVKKKIDKHEREKKRDTSRKTANYIINILIFASHFI